LPWGEERHVETDVEQFSLDTMSMTAMYYIDCPDPTLVVVKSEDFQLVEDDTFVVRSCKVTLTDAWDEEEDEDRIEQIWKDFILLDDSIPPRITRRQ
jgi:hypothetical protein